MIGALDFLREFTYPSIFLRLALAMLFGGIIGLEGTRKGRAAGFRTYILVSIGSALTILLGQYMAQMLELSWNSEEGARVDTARMGAQVINGIGFLGAGTILVTNRQQVKGLTTAAGLWTSACVGLAIGAGFYECVIPAFLLVFAVVKLLPYGEDLIIENLRNINLYMEYDKLEHTGKVVDQIRKLGVQIYEIRSTDRVFRRANGPRRCSPCG